MVDHVDVIIDDIDIRVEILVSSTSVCGCSYVTYMTTATERAAHTPPFPPVELLSSVASESVSAERPKERARPAPAGEGAKTWAWRRLGLGAAGSGARRLGRRAAQHETLHQGRLCLRRSTKGGSARDARPATKQTSQHEDLTHYPTFCTC